MEKDTKIVLIVVSTATVILTTIFIMINLNALKPAQPSVPTVYQDIDYGGRSQEYGPGSYTLSQMQKKGTTNDSISSIEIPAGFSVTLYKDDHFKGDSTVKSANDSTLVDNDWNDRVSSMVITKTP